MEYWSACSSERSRDTGIANGMATFATPVPTGTGCCANFVRSVAFDAADKRLWFVQSDGIVGFANSAAVVPGSGAGIVDKLVTTSLMGGGTFHQGLFDIAIVGVARVGTPSTSGTSLSVNQICVGPPADRCSLVYLVSSHEYITGFPGSKASAAKRRVKPKPVILGTKTITLKGGQHKVVTVKLNAKGRKLLKNSPTGKLTVYFTVTQKRAKGKLPKRLKATKVTFKRKQR